MVTRKQNKDGRYGLVVSHAQVLPREEKEFGNLKTLGYFYKTQGDAQKIFELFKDNQTMADHVREIDIGSMEGPTDRKNEKLGLDSIKPFKREDPYNECWVNAISVAKADQSEPTIYLQKSFCNSTTFPSIRMFAMWLRSFDPNKPLNFTTILITGDNKMLITDKIIDYQKYKAQQSDFLVNSFEVGPIPLAEYFGCQVPLTSTRSIKGFFYSKKKYYAIFSR